MADLAASDVSVTLVQKRHIEGRSCNRLTLTFGNGSLTYPAGGVPITKGKLGCPNVIESLVIFGKGTSGYEWSYDSVNEKLVAVYSAAGSSSTHTHTLFLKDGSVADSSGARVNAATGNLGANTGGNLSIAGVTGTGGSGGIVQSAALSVAAAALAQPSAVAIASQVLQCEVIGW